MDMKLFWLTFTTVFVAEMGDKTQLATLGFAGESRKPVQVFLAASAGLVAATAIGAAAGGVITRFVPVSWMKRGSAVLFIVLGVWLLVKEFRGAKD